MAAKAESIHYHSRQVGVRRGLRRHRNTMPKPLRIPAKVPEESESKSAPLVSSRQFSFPSPVRSPLPVTLFSRATATTIDIDTDTDTETGTFLDGADAEEPKLVETSPQYLTDFSNYLGISFLKDADDDDASVTVVDSEGYSRTNSAEDLYGWEAELERQMDCSMTTSGVVVCNCDGPCGYRREESSKRGLLHRVLSMGSAIQTVRRTNSGF